MGETYMLESLWVKNPWGRPGVDGMLAFVPPSQVWQSIWHIFSQSFYLTYLVTVFLAFYLEHIRRSLWSRSGGETLTLSLLFGSGGEHCDHELEVDARRRKEEEGGKRS